MLPIGHHVS
jgi:hypothetical protein